jgi:hypothetical protein
MVFFLLCRLGNVLEAIFHSLGIVYCLCHKGSTPVLLTTLMISYTTRL